MKFQRGQGSSDLSKLIQDLEDGVISPDDHHELMANLRHSGESRGLYLKHMRLAALLRQTAETRGDLGTIPVSQEMLVRERRKSAWAAIAWGVAAVLLVALGLALFQVRIDFGDKRSNVAWEVSQDARYFISRHSDGAEDGKTRSDDALLAGDRVILKHGLLRLKFPSQVEAIIEGPSELEMRSESEIRLDGGLAWFRVPEAGQGFTVSTDRARVIDLGTEFGVWFSGQDSLQVHVAKGRVRIEPTDPEHRPYEVRAGEARKMDTVVSDGEVDFQPDLFRRKFDDQIPYLHWSFDHLFRGAFPASGTLAKGRRDQAEMRRLDGEPSESDLSASQTEGVRGGALRLTGDGMFARTGFPGIGGNAPRTVAGWLRHRGREPRFPNAARHDSRDHPYPGYGASTPFGDQAYLFNYGGTGLTSARGTLGPLTAGTRYELKFHVAARPGLPNAAYRVELVAFDAQQDDSFRAKRERFGEATVLAHVSGVAEASDMSEHATIVFTARSDSPHLGKDLAIRFVQQQKLVRFQGSDRHSGRVLFDHIRLTARAGDGEPVSLLSESFETPRVAGFSLGTSVGDAWVAAGFHEHQGILNQHAPFTAAYYAWGGLAPGEMWAGFVDDSKSPHWSLGTGRFWIASQGPRSSLRADRWTHFATVFTGKLTENGEPEILHYIGGELLESLPVASLWRESYPAINTRVGGSANHHLCFGALPGMPAGAPTLNGDLDEFFIFRGVLTQGDIRKLMETHTPLFLEK